MISVTQYGDVLPCPYIHTSIGNVFQESLQKIINRGLSIKYFGEYVETCLIAEDRKFIHDYVVKKYMASHYLFHMMRCLMRRAII